MLGVVFVSPCCLHVVAWTPALSLLLLGLSGKLLNFALSLSVCLSVSSPLPLSYLFISLPIANITLTAYIYMLDCLSYFLISLENYSTFLYPFSYASLFPPLLSLIFLINLPFHH